MKKEKNLDLKGRCSENNQLKIKKIQNNLNKKEKKVNQKMRKKMIKKRIIELLEYLSIKLNKALNNHLLMRKMKIMNILL